MSKSVSWVLLLLWAVGILTALLVYAQRQLTEFDPDGLLLHQSTSPNFDHQLTNILKQLDVRAASIVHIGSNQHCYCESLTTPHQTQLANYLESDAYTLQNINIEDAAPLRALLSQVPALIVIDKYYQLRYLGPYATGYGCFTGKNLVQQIISYTQTTPYHGAVINADAVGCFC